MFSFLSSCIFLRVNFEIVSCVGKIHIKLNASIRHYNLTSGRRYLFVEAVIDQRFANLIGCFVDPSFKVVRTRRPSIFLTACIIDDCIHTVHPLMTFRYRRIQISDAGVCADVVLDAWHFTTDRSFVDWLNGCCVMVNSCRWWFSLLINDVVVYVLNLVNPNAAFVLWIPFQFLESTSVNRNTSQSDRKHKHISMRKIQNENASISTQLAVE